MKVFALTSLAGAGMIILASHLAQTPVDKQAAVLKEAKTLKITYTFQHVPGTRADYTLTYSKPNLLLITGPDRVVETDGKTLWEYNKAANSYTESPLTPELLTKKAESDEVLAWASFFTDDLVKHATDMKVGGSRPIKGQPTTEVTFTTGGANPKTVTLYVDDKLGVARGFSAKTSTGDVIALASSVTVSGDGMTSDQFAFNAPTGATKIAAPAPDALGWATVQPIFNGNCTPCHSGRGKGGFSINSYQSVMKGSEDGPVITPGDPDNSKLIQLISGQAQPKMPPGGNVSAADIDKLKAWIKAGAKE